MDAAVQEPEALVSDSALPGEDVAPLDDALPVSDALPIEDAQLAEDTQPVESPPTGDGTFQVHLANYDGPFDLLLGLIAKHKLDITEIALAKVTDEFISFIRAQGADWDLGVASEFLVVAATLLDLKAARLLPQGEIEDEEDLALLEARDLLFARLLQYKAYKLVAAEFATRMALEARRFPRVVAMEESFAQLLPEVLIGLTPEEFAALAVKAMAPKPEPPSVGLEHLHMPRVSVREQAAIIVDKLRRSGNTTFRALVADCPDTAHKIARFLALLELFREAVLAFDQITALGELHIRWTGSDDAEVELTDEFDGDAGEPAGEQPTGVDPVDVELPEQRAGIDEDRMHPNTGSGPDRPQEGP